jgi:hypothetical protein
MVAALAQYSLAQFWTLVDEYGQQKITKLPFYFSLFHDSKFGPAEEDMQIAAAAWPAASWVGGGLGQAQPVARPFFFEPRHGAYESPPPPTPGRPGPPRHAHAHNQGIFFGEGLSLSARQRSAPPQKTAGSYRLPNNSIFFSSRLQAPSTRKKAPDLARLPFWVQSGY